LPRAPQAAEEREARRDSSSRRRSSPPGWLGLLARSGLPPDVRSALWTIAVAVADLRGAAWALATWRDPGFRQAAREDPESVFAPDALVSGDDGEPPGAAELRQSGLAFLRAGCRHLWRALPAGDRERVRELVGGPGGSPCWCDAGGAGVLERALLE